MTTRLTRLMEDGTPDIVQHLRFDWPRTVVVRYFDGTVEMYPEEIMYTLEGMETEEERMAAAMQDARTLFFARPEVKHAILSQSGINIAGREEQASLLYCSNIGSYVDQWYASDAAR